MTGKGMIPLSVELAKRLYGFYNKDESLLITVNRNVLVVGVITDHGLE